MESASRMLYVALTNHALSRIPMTPPQQPDFVVLVPDKASALSILATGASQEERYG